MRLAVFTALAVATSIPVARTQERQVIINGQPADPGMLFPGMGQRQFKTGTGRILGRVVNAETGAPLRRAQVRVTGPDIAPKAAFTDAEGRFEFRELPAGRFNLNATKAGYVTVQYGQTRPHESGRPIELADKQVVDKADIGMPRGGVISGRIVDEFGEPVADAQVSAMRQSWMGGRKRMVPAGRTASTNDLGQYRMYGLPPGDYYISATVRNNDVMMFDMFGASAGPQGSNPSSGYAPTYFPGTNAAADAQRLSLGAGQDVQNTDFALVAVRLAKITGIVITSDGKPLESAMVSTMPAGRGADVGAGMMMMGGTGRTNNQGAFTINAVPPGEYNLNVRTVRTITTGDGGNMVFTSTIGGPGGAGDDAEFAVLPITVAGEDLANVTIVTSKGVTARGTLSFDGGTKPANLTGIRLMASPADAESGPVMMGASSTVKPDGTFEIKGLSGARIIRPAGLPQGWMLKSVRLNATDITDTGTEFKAGAEVTGLEVVLTSRLTEINGGVTTSDGTALKDYTVVIFSDNPDHWAMPVSRWVTGTRPDQEGRFRVRNMPPGGYYAIAIDYVESGAWSDPELLDRLKSKAKRITLAEGETETLELKLSDTQ
jgi:hypothetical protein